MMRFTGGLVIALGLAVICFATPVAAEINVGTVDLAQIREKADRFQQAFDEIDEMVADFENRRDDRQAELQELADDLENSSQLGGSSFDRQRREMADKSAEYQEFMEETFGTDGIIDTKSSELLAPLYADLAIAGEKVAKTLGLDLILDLEQINPLFAAESLDVTDAVLEEFKKMR